MTNDLPDALIEKVARAIWNYENDGRSNEVLDVEWSLLEEDYKLMAQHFLEALDISGIISDLRFYAEVEHPADKFEPLGQRARTRLSSLGITNNGGNNEK